MSIYGIIVEIVVRAAKRAGLVREHRAGFFMKGFQTRYFWSLVEKSDGCWQWYGNVGPWGYGQYGSARAHRLVYALLIRPLPPEIELHHECFNKLCVKPAHLRELTKSEHSKLSYTATINRQKTQCPQGHPYISSNLLLSSKGYRRCKTCKHSYDRKRARKPQNGNSGNSDLAISTTSP